MRKAWWAGAVVACAVAGRAEAGGLSRKPELIAERTPPFPWSKEAIQHQAQGVVWLRCGLSQAGYTYNCHVVRGLDHVRESELLVYAAGLVFTPALGSNGHPVELESFVFPVRLVPPRFYPRLQLHFPKPH